MANYENFKLCSGAVGNATQKLYSELLTHSAVMKAHKREGVEEVYAKILENINKKSTATIKW